MMKWDTTCSSLDHNLYRSNGKERGDYYLGFKGLLSRGLGV